MPHVSKYKLKEVLFDELFNQLITIQHGLTKPQSKLFLSSLLTQTEKVMLTKRCAVVVMLYEGKSSYKIWNTLKMSQSSVARIKRQYEEGQYDSLVTAFRKNKIEKEKFWNTLELIVRAGMPSMGKKRWTSL